MNELERNRRWIGKSERGQDQNAKPEATDVVARTDNGGNKQEGDFNCLTEITLDKNSIKRALPQVEHERMAAIYDLIQENSFALPGDEPGPYKLTLALQDNRLVFDIARDRDERRLVLHMLSLTPFKRIVKDYFLICESYYDAIKHATISQIETIDMARRGVHDEAAQILIDRLKGKIDIDETTARRLFTLICALHWKG